MKCIYMFCMVLKISNDDYTVQHSLVGPHNERGGVFTAWYEINLYNKRCLCVCLWQVLTHQKPEIGA
jgi:hypothetical protein